MLVVFRCRSCTAPLSNPLERREWRPLPSVKSREHYTYGPSTVPVGSFSTDPDPYDPAGSVATWVINPLDGVLLRPHVDTSRLYGCCRRDGLNGPNLLCGRCNSEVGVEISDCWTEYDVRLLTTAVSTTGAPAATAGDTPPRRQGRP
ncbi:hypothetical protein [Streptomyces zaomyceticus]|uniref:hypothetical protein n=1 Tax=Streptomyces zaomyceticus TaxID=68286 RepID=UPI00342EABBB